MRIAALGAEAIPQVEERIGTWIDSNAFQGLVEAFKWRDDPASPLRTRIHSLVTQSDEWDYRRRTARRETSGPGGITEATRWTSNDATLTASQRRAALDAARDLGLTSASVPFHTEYRSVMVLGGARLSCLLRTRRAAKLITRGLKTREVALLGSERPVADSERDATDSYAPGAATEFELFLAAGQAELGIDAHSHRGERHEDAHANLSWEVREYQGVSALRVITLSAPSTEPTKRRANSADTYLFFMRRYGLRPGDRVLLVTSQIYVPYQQLEALRILAVPHKIGVETTGFPPTWGGRLQGMTGPQHYLQEIRSFLQAAARFVTMDAA